MLTKERRLKKGLKGKTRKRHIHHVPPLLYRLQENRSRLYNELKNLPKESNAVILNVLQGNDWQPVTVKKNRR